MADVVLSTEVGVVEKGGVDALADLDGGADAGPDGIAGGTLGAVGKPGAVASIKAGIDGSGVVEEFVLPKHPDFGNEQNRFA